MKKKKNGGEEIEHLPLRKRKNLAHEDKEKRRKSAMKIPLDTKD